MPSVVVDSGNGSKQAETGEKRRNSHDLAFGLHHKASIWKSPHSLTRKLGFEVQWNGKPG